MEQFELVSLADGVFSLRSRSNNETFHPAIGPQAEAQILHVDQQKIVGRAQQSSDFVLWDVGLGAAANALCAIRAILESPSQQIHPVTIESFDKTTGPLEFALQNTDSLIYIKGYESIIHQLLNNGSVNIQNKIIWNLHLGDFVSDLRNISLRSPDSIFYDPYSVKENIEMWTLSHFTKLFSKLDPKRRCVLSNYTASTYVRVTLLLAGFNVGWGCQVDRKLHTTIASNCLDALERPLGRDWLTDRVRVSHSASPVRDLPHLIAPISEEDYEKLLSLPQFC